MSIISEALKKVQKERGQSSYSLDAGAINLKPGTTIIKEEKKKAVNLFATKIIIAWCCGFILIFVAILFIFPTHKKGSAKYLPNISLEPFTGAAGSTETVTTGQSQPLSAAVKGAAFNKILDPFTNRQGFKLSGIMVSDDGPMAIINNKIVKEGDGIAGATVISIGEEEAKLSYEGQEITLSIK